MSSEAAKRATKRMIELLFHGRVKSLESNPVVAIIDSELEAERAERDRLKEALDRQTHNAVEAVVERDEARAAARVMKDALRDIIRDHNERMMLYPDLNNQPNRIRVMENGHTALAAAEKVGI